MESSGLPAIVSYYAAGWISLEQMMVDGDLTAEEEEACADVLDVLKNSVKGKTLGPKDPPAELKPIDFLNYIINLKHEAFTLGWITNKGIEMSLDQKLDAAKKKLEQGQNSTAKNILNALINEVEAQGCETYDNCLKGKHLLPEAYALLKYNVLYLIERL
ncbi:MAG: hypothetical protein HY805_10450 [Nitrospirae bacterium]|nr:hypothetical protein [Nitrospirota bacterium]